MGYGAKTFPMDRPFMNFCSLIRCRFGENTQQWLAGFSACTVAGLSVAGANAVRYSHTTMLPNDFFVVARSYIFLEACLGLGTRCGAVASICMAIDAIADIYHRAWTRTSTVPA